MSVTDKDLGGLFSVITTGLTEVIRDGETMLDGEGNAIRKTASPAYFTAGIALLKNNNITADASGNAELKALADQLKARRNKKVNPLALEAAAQEYSDRHGMMQ